MTSNLNRNGEFKPYKMKFSLKPDQASLLIDHGTIINTSEDESFYYLPHWYRRVGDLWEVVPFDKLPQEVRDIIAKKNQMALERLEEIKNQII